MIKKLNIILFLIIFTATLFRFFGLAKSPPSLNWDEAALGYNAYSLLKTGSDEYGHPLPLVLRSFDDYKPALYAYLTAPVIAVFGLNEFSVRFLSALSGVVSVLLVFLIAKKLFNDKVAVYSALFMAIEPFTVHFSRAAFEANVGLALVLAGITAALYIKTPIYKIIFSYIFFGLSAYTYHANRVLLPLMVFLVFWQNRKYFNTTKSKIIISLVALVIVLPLLYIVFSGEGLQRLQSTSITKLWQKEKPLYSALDNPIYNFGKEITGRYFSYFSPANIFARGAAEPNQRIPGFALFFTLDFIFYVLGFYYFAKNSFKPKFLLYLLIIAPLPAVITWNWFSPVRTLLLYAMLTLILGLGTDRLISAIKKSGKVFKFSALAFLLVFYSNTVLNLATSVLFYLPYMEKGNWQYGFREIMEYVAPLADGYDRIVFETGHAQPHIFTLFYSKYDPARYHRELGSPDAVEKPRKNFNFGKYEFRKIYWPDDRSLGKTLFIGSEFNLPAQDIESAKNAKHLKDIYDRNGDFVARIVETE